LLRGLGATLWVPLWWDDAQRGALVLGPRAGEDPYQEPHLRQISALAGTLALALYAQQLVSHLQERTTSLVALTHRLSQAHEQERAHLSRELHDVVAQELIALTRQLRRYSHESPPPPAIWADMLAAAQDALAATRRICNGLRPAILDLGLVPALRDLVAEVTGREGGPEVGLTIAGPERRLSGEVEFVLFRVAQEGLNNALAHSGARQVRVEACFEGGVCLRVRDDGGGFVVPPRLEDLPGDHLGLIGMRERLAELGGILIVTSTPGQGTVVEARVA
jgi:two-component system NarL family sensor kinase